jgi:hypothetical protein
MSNPTRARGHAWQFVDGMFCLTVHGENREASVSIPIGALLTLAADGRRRQTALHRQTMAERETVSPGATPVKHEAMLPVQSWSVATADNGMLVLIIDRGLDTEMLLSLSHEVAETLADLFLKHTRGAAGAQTQS